VSAVTNRRKSDDELDGVCSCFFVITGGNLTNNKSLRDLVIDHSIRLSPATSFHFLLSYFTDLADS